MFDQILQEGEGVWLSGQGEYSGHGGRFAIETGDFVLTNRRFIVAKNKSGVNGGIMAGIVGVVVIAGPQIIGIRLGVIDAAILGGLTAAAVGGIAKLFRGKPKPIEEKNIIITLAHEDIMQVEDGKQGLRKMLVITARDGSTYKISAKNKDEWRAALLNVVNHFNGNVNWEQR